MCASVQANTHFVFIDPKIGVQGPRSPLGPHCRTPWTDTKNETLTPLAAVGVLNGPQICFTCCIQNNKDTRTGSSVPSHVQKSQKIAWRIPWSCAMCMLKHTFCFHWSKNWRLRSPLPPLAPTVRPPGRTQKRNFNTAGGGGGRSCLFANIRMKIETHQLVRFSVTTARSDYHKSNAKTQADFLR